jgi:hypothetical protein
LRTFVSLQVQEKGMKWKKIQEDLNRYADSCRDKYRELMPMGPGGVIIQLPTPQANMKAEGEGPAEGPAEGKESEAEAVGDGVVSVPVEAARLPEVKKGEPIRPCPKLLQT